MLNQGFKTRIGSVLLWYGFIQDIMDIVANTYELLAIIADCYDDSSNT